MMDMLPLVNVTTAFGLFLVVLAVIGFMTSSDHRLLVSAPALLGIPVIIAGWFAGIERYAVPVCNGVTLVALLVWLLLIVDPVNPFRLVIGDAFENSPVRPIAEWMGWGCLLYVFSSIGWNIRRRLGIMPNI